MWKEHLGLLPHTEPDQVTNDMLPLPVPQVDDTSSEEDTLVMDPLDDETLERWNFTAKTNTEAFREVFHCVPDDTGKILHGVAIHPPFFRFLITINSNQLGGIQVILP